jgi:hypothetical protein
MGKYNNTVAFLDNHRWPTQESEALYFELNTSKQAINRPAKRIRPPALPMPLLESIDPVTLDKLLTAASLKVKRVKRYPNWVLQTVYNLGRRPLQFI